MVTVNTLGPIAYTACSAAGTCMLGSVIVKHGTCLQPYTRILAAAIVNY